MNVNTRLIGMIVLILMGGLMLEACGTFQVGVVTAEADQAGSAVTEMPAVQETGRSETSEDIQIHELPASETATIEVVGWLGRVLSPPSGSQFDDYLELAPQGSGEFGLTGANAEIETEITALRDKKGAGEYANFWGELTCGVPDYGGCQLVASRIRTGASMAGPEAVEGWQGSIQSSTPSTQFDDAFVLAGDYPVQFGISSMIAQNGWPLYAEELKGLRDSGKLVEVWGELLCGVPDVNGCQVQVARMQADGEEVDPYSGWERYENQEYGFRLRYPATWDLVDVPPEDTRPQGGPVFGASVQITDNNTRLIIEYRHLDEEVVMGGTGMPAGDQEMMGMVRILGLDLEKIALVYEGRIKMVIYSPAKVDGLEFVMQVDDTSGQDYQGVELPMEVLVEIDQILGTLEVVGVDE